MQAMSDDDGPDDPFGPGPFGGLPFLGNLGDMFGAGADPWANARQIAGSVASGGETEPNVDPAERIAYEQLARVAELQVTTTTGLRVGDGTPPLVRPATRHEWALATLDAWRPLLSVLGDAMAQPISSDIAEMDPEDLQAGLGAMGMGGDFMAQIFKMLGPMMLSMTAGSMVGQMARTKLGSYDLPLPRPPGGELLVVNANLAEFVQEWSVPADDMRLWVCLHEYLHHAVLTLPHIEQRITELTNAYVNAFESSTQAMTDRFGSINPADPESMSGLQNLMNDPEALMGVVQSDRQRAMLPEISAVLAAIVGWVDHMMDRIGSTLITSYPMLTEALRRRRVTANPADRFMERMLGLELDQACYDTGRAFVDGVVERSGDAALARLWESDRELPTPNEIVAPGLWLARIDLALDLGDEATPATEDAEEE